MFGKGEHGTNMCFVNLPLLDSLTGSLYKKKKTKKSFKSQNIIFAKNAPNNKILVICQRTNCGEVSLKFLKL